MKKNFLKKTAAILLSAAMCTSMVACGSGTGSTAATADDGQKTYTVGVVQYVDDASLNQIEEKNYALPYVSSGKRIVKIGADFSTKIGSLDSWKIHTENEK